MLLANIPLPSHCENHIVIYKILKTSQEKFHSNSAAAVSQWVAKKLEAQQTLKLEYFQIADETQLLPCLRKNKQKKYRAFIAVFVNKTRLIDTISLY